LLFFFVVVVSVEPRVIDSSAETKLESKLESAASSKETDFAFFSGDGDSALESTSPEEKKVVSDNFHWNRNTKKIQTNPHLFFLPCLLLVPVDT